MSDNSTPNTIVDGAGVLLLQRSGLFDGPWFLARNPDLAVWGGPFALAHFNQFGWREHRWPNAYFDPAWYLTQNPGVAAREENPLLHYVLQGEAEGRPPIAWFDPEWYRARYQVPEGMLALAHFLLHRTGGRVSPVPEFDAEHYLARYPDVAGLDPFEHYMVRGAAEDREPRPGFDAAAFRARHLAGRADGNPVLHLRSRNGRAANEACVHREVRRNTTPGPHFEEWSPQPGPRLAKLLAFYLPQFHAVPENDVWWGKGFTEWTNVSRALPRFAGHYQPRIPRDLGHYSLDGGATLRRQAAMARAAGLHGFVFYHYSFNGRRLLNGPMDTLLADRSIDLPFCLMWANENWTRRWDGSEHEVLIAQDYDPADEPALVADFLRHFADPRYIRLQGRPVLMVYRAGIVPPGAVTRWRNLFAEAGEDPFIVMAQSFNDRDPSLHGMDAAVEFPPHKLTDGLDRINDSLTMLDPETTARIYHYDDLVAASDVTPTPFPLIRTALPGWDNDARRQGAGMTLHGATPAAYQAWLERLIAAARQQPVGGEAIVCVNAWNEWAEGAYLEPDVHFGAAFLNATSRAVVDEGPGLLLVGHDAFAAGAQLLLLNLAIRLRAAFGVRVEVLLLGGGALLDRYRDAAPTTVVAPADLPRHAAALHRRGLRHAIVNTCAAADAVPALHEAGIAATLLVHEQPRLLRERNLVGPTRQAVAVASAVVFAADHVRDRFSELVELPAGRTAILLQGLYRPVLATDRDARRAALNIPAHGTLALGLGYGDLRKGIDLFLQAWRVARRRDPAAHFLWVGDLDPGVASQLGPEMAAAKATGTFHHRPYAHDGADWLAAADTLLLTSREDPMPTVVMEAMSAGVPTIAFEDSGAAPDLLRDCSGGGAVPMGDVSAMVRHMRQLPRRPDPELAARARRLFDFDRYAARLLHLAWPGLADVSVVVPNFDYARYLPARLNSIFAQDHPVTEVIVLDDASSDASEAAARATAAAAGRHVEWVANPVNSGSVMGQWRRAARLARGEFLWIAEADDACEPGMLAELCRAAAAPDIVMAFCDGRAIDRDGAVLWPDHKTYFGPGVLAEDTVFDAAEMLRRNLASRNLVLNVSAVLFRREPLLAAFERCAAELDGFGGAGDWRLYAELMAGGGRVAYVARPLNAHRRHAGSVTALNPQSSVTREAARMRRVVRAALRRLERDRVEVAEPA